MRAPRASGGPPRWMEALLRAALPDDLAGESIVGDARESWDHLRSTRGPLGAGAAYLALVLRLVLGYALPLRLRGAASVLADLLRESGRSLRRLARSPGSALSAVTVLATGTGLVVLVFALVQGVFLRGMGYPDEDRLVGIRAVAPSIDLDAGLFSTVQSQALAGALAGATEGVASWTQGATVLESEGGAWRLQAAWVSGNALPLLGVPAQLGRTLLPGDDAPRGEAAVVLSHRSWMRDLSGDRDVLGRTVRVEGRSGRIVGVMPEGFAFPQMAEVWMTHALSPGLITVDGDSRDAVELFARRAPGIGSEGFEAALAAAAPALRATLDDPAPDLRPVSRPLARAVLGEEIPGFLVLVMAAAGLVLLVACANVANLLLARAWSRTGEVGVRRALGSSRSRAVLPFLSEACVLATVGTGLGLAAATVGMRWLDETVRPRPEHMSFEMDATLALFAAAVAAGTALLAGILPAARASGVRIVDVMKGAGGRHAGGRVGRAGRVLVVAEVALSCAVLVGGAVTGRSLLTTLARDPGFDVDAIQVARLGVDRTRPAQGEAAPVRMAALLERLKADGGYEAVAATTTLPAVDGVDPELEVDDVPAGGPEGSGPRGTVLSVTPGYFDVLGAAPLVGRGLERTDGPDAPPVAVVDGPLARRLWGSASPLGRRVRPRGSETWYTVVGVVPDLVPQGLNPAAEPGGLYLSLLQTQPKGAWIMARGGSGAPLAPTLRASLRGVGEVAPVWNGGTLSDEIRAEHWPLFVFGSLFLAFGVAALLTAGVGLYGVLAFQVRDRARELGVRAALGAGGARIVREAMQRLLAQVAVGALVGLGVGWAAASGLERVSPGVDPRSPAVYLAVAGLVMGVAALAAWFPARRATRVDPVVALRGE